MQLSETVQLVATFVEVVITLFSLYIAWNRKKLYAGFIAITFSLFVTFDIGRIFLLKISPDVHSGIFLIACLSMLFAVWLMWREG
jgi:hypothetical protein